jgi:hypothetical protein
MWFTYVQANREKVKNWLSANKQRSFWIVGLICLGEFGLNASRFQVHGRWMHSVFLVLPFTVLFASLGAFYIYNAITWKPDMAQGERK